MERLFEIFSPAYLASVFVVLVHAGVGFYFLIADIEVPEYQSGGGNDEELVEIITEDELDLPEDPEQQPEGEDAALNPEDVTALSGDVNDTRETSESDYSQYVNRNAGQTAEESVQNMIDEYQNDLDAQGKKYDTGLGEEKKYDYKKLGDDEVGGDGKVKKAGKTMADFDFSSPSRTPRNARGLKIPGYTGKGSGVIYVKVVIDPIGYVIGKPTIDYSKTTMTEPYALQQAIEFARKERFQRDPNAPKKQEGYFIYTYIAQ